MHVSFVVFVAMALSVAPPEFQDAAPTRAQFCAVAPRLCDRPSGHAPNPDRRRNVGSAEAYRVIKLACSARVGCRDRHVSPDGLRLLVVALGQSYGAVVLAFS